MSLGFPLTPDPHPGLRHGSLRSRCVIDGEDAAEFDRLHLSYLAGRKPVGAVERGYLDEMVAEKWKLQLIERLWAARLSSQVGACRASEYEAFMRTFVAVSDPDAPASHPRVLEAIIEQGVNEKAPALLRECLSQAKSFRKKTKDAMDDTVAGVWRAHAETEVTKGLERLRREAEERYRRAATSLERLQAARKRQA